MSRGKSKRRGITASAPKENHRIKAREAHDGLLTFSFRHFDLSDGGFDPSDRAAKYFLAVLKRLQGLCGMRTMEVKADRSPVLRAHPIDWSHTSRPKGFRKLNKQLRDLEPYQFSVTSNKHGRVHGFFLDDVFYVVWFDPDHTLYPRN